MRKFISYCHFPMILKRDVVSRLIRGLTLELNLPPMAVINTLQSFQNVADCNYQKLSVFPDLKYIVPDACG